VSVDYHTGRTVRDSDYGYEAGATNTENERRHKVWCDDLATKLLCVFALDRFGDYVSDQVIAPVRETASQTLAALLVHMPSSSVFAVHSILLDMIRQEHLPAPALSGMVVKGKETKRTCIWEIRHAGLLGLKYLVAAKESMLKETDGMKVDGADEQPLGQEMLLDVVNVAMLRCVCFLSV
jgi:TATA-binding protein-associated factor